jgi:hypothetical protein
MSNNSLTRPFLSVLSFEDRCVPSAVAVKSADDSIMYTTSAADTVSPTPVVPAKRFAVGSGAGAVATVNVYDAKTNDVISTMTPFGPTYTGGVRVATADFTGDGIDDLAVATATGAARVMAFDGATGATIADFTPFAATGTGGAFVSTGDVNGDGRADLVVGSGVGRAPEVRVFAGQSLGTAPPAVVANASAKVATPALVTAPTPIHTFTPVGATAAYGVRVAAGDLNGDGKAEVVSASGNSVYSHQLSHVNDRFAPTRRGAVLKTVVASKQATFPFAADTQGVFVAVGDFSGTGRNDIAAGFVANGRARVRVVNGTDMKTMVMDAYSFNPGADGGVVVAMRDVTGDGKAEVFAASGLGQPVVRVLGGGVGGLTRSFSAFPANYQGGVYIG